MSDGFIYDLSSVTTDVKPVWGFFFLLYKNEKSKKKKNFSYYRK